MSESVKDLDKILDEEDAFAFWENRSTLTRGTEEVDISRWTIVKSSHRCDLHKYLANGQLAFSEKFLSRYDRAYNQAPIHHGTGGWKFCYLCNELNLDGLTHTRPVYRYDHPGERRTTRSWPYLLALYHECSGCKVLVDFIVRKWWNHTNDFASMIQSASIEAQIEELAMKSGDRKNTSESWFRAVSCSVTSGTHSRYEGHLSSSPMQSTLEMSNSLTTIDLHFNLPTLQSWVSFCDRSHTCLEADFELARDESVRLIDVSRMQVITSNDIRRAAALSYVWGPPELVSIKMSRDNQALLMSDRGIQMVEDRVPKTIRDAIAICKGMGIPYLWCDMFCNVQDDVVDLNKQLSMMQRIYKHSYITLICAHGNNANAGIPGSPLNSRKNPQWSFVENGVRFLEVYKSMQDIKNTIWDTRAWTYQEKHLSQRMLVFTDTQAYFQCQQDVVPSETINQLQTGFRSDIIYYLRVFRNLKLFQTAGHLLETYCYLVEEYSRRQLTKREDSLYAITGILTEFTENVGWHFHFGLPLPVFSQALCWCERITNLRHIDDEFPSWTWASYVGTRKPCSVSFGRIACVDFYVELKTKWFKLSSNAVKPPSGLPESLAPAPPPVLTNTTRKTTVNVPKIQRALKTASGHISPKQRSFLICTETEFINITCEDAVNIFTDNVTSENWCPLNLKTWKPQIAYGCYQIMTGEYTDQSSYPHLRKKCVWALLVTTDGHGVSKRVRPVRFSAENFDWY